MPSCRHVLREVGIALPKNRAGTYGIFIRRRHSAKKIEEWMSRQREGHTSSAGDQKGALAAPSAPGGCTVRCAARRSLGARAGARSEPRTARPGRCVDRGRRVQRVLRRSPAERVSRESLRRLKPPPSNRCARRPTPASPFAAWKLARIYADGDGVPRDDRKRFRRIFPDLVERFANDDPSPCCSERFMGSNASARAPRLSQGRSRRGGHQARFRQRRLSDLSRATPPPSFAALMRNIAQGATHPKGVGVKKESRAQAEHELGRALLARKGHTGAQALLGQERCSRSLLNACVV